MYDLLTCIFMLLMFQNRENFTLHQLCKPQMNNLLHDSTEMLQNNANMLCLNISTGRLWYTVNAYIGWAFSVDVTRLQKISIYHQTSFVNLHRIRHSMHA